MNKVLATGNMEKQAISDTVRISRTTLWQWEKSGKLNAR
jgi:DNA-binding XRE family transcriptional regulator